MDASCGETLLKEVPILSAPGLILRLVAHQGIAVGWMAEPKCPAGIRRIFEKAAASACVWMRGNGPEPNPVQPDSPNS
jgi:hypothetical protein